MICPYGSSCQCTLGEACSAVVYGAQRAQPAGLRRADGTCAGTCLQIVEGLCPGPSSCVANSGACVAPPPCLPPAANETARSVLLTLAHQGFSGRPGSLVYVPTTFDSAQQALSVVLFVHGFHNCVANCVLPEANGCNCSVGGGGGSNQGYDLLDSFEAAALAEATRLGGGAAPSTSVAQSIFVAAEVAYDEASSATGNWSTPGMFSSFLADILASSELAPLAGGPRSVADVSRVRLFSHSGGYAVLAAFATPSVNGNLSAALEVGLLDSLYGSEDAYDAFVEDALAQSRLGPGAAQARFVSIYTDTGGTAANNRAMAARAAAWLAAANASALMLDDDSLDAPLPAAAVAGTPVIFKRSNLTHDDTCRHYFALFLSGERYD